jgi:hypothetical protein
MKENILGLLILSLPSLAFGQFNKSIGTYKDQQGHSVQRTRVDPGFIAAGQDGQWVFGGKEASIVKTKPDGTPQWAMMYGGVGNETFNSIREIHEHNELKVDGYAALGTTTSFASTEDLYFVRTDITGTPLYSFTFGRREGNERGHCLQYIKDYATGNLGYIMVGQADSYTYFGDSTDILIVKTDESGALTGAKVIGGTGEDIAYWVEQTSDGDFVVTGSTTSLSASKDIFVMRLDRNLNIVWQSSFLNREIFSEDVGYSVVENPIDGSFTVTGFTTSFGLGNSQDAFLLNLQPDGSVNWMRTYGTNQPEQGLSIDLSSGGKEYVVAGFAVSKTRGKDAWVFKTDMAGNPIWSNLYGAPSDSTELATEITSDGASGYVFVGMAESAFFTNNEDYYLVNLDVNGKTGACEIEFTQAWERHEPFTYRSFEAVEVNDIKVACTQYERAEYVARKCKDQILRDDPAAQTEVFSISPNPTSTSIKILFLDVAIKEEGGTVAVFDRNGKIVYKGDVTSDEMQVPVEGLPSDVYIVRFTTREGKQYQKRFFKK